jgi:integrase
MSIRKRGMRSFQVRVAGFPAQTAPTREAAETIERDLKRRKALGRQYEAPAITLGEAIDQTLEGINATRGVSEKTLAHATSSAKVLAPLREQLVSSLRAAEIEHLILERAEQHPRSAKNELEFLKRVLRDAQRGGQRVDEGIFEIPPVRHRPARRRGLTVSELHELASCFPEQCARLILLAGQVGCRQSVWFNLTDEMLDLEAGTLTIPAALAKRQGEHRIHLTELEVKLLREQLLVRPAGTNLVFPTLEGKRWTANRFRDRVWLRSLDVAVENDENRNAAESSIFEGFTFHMLRHTAASLMALAGMDPAVAAERLEHSDGGALFQKAYRNQHASEKREQAQRLDALILAELDTEGTARPETRPERRNQAVSEVQRYWAQLTCALHKSVGLSPGLSSLRGRGSTMRKLDWRLSGAAIAVLVVGGFAIGVGFSHSNHTATPIASSVLNASRNSPKATNNGPVTHLRGGRKPVVSKPQQLFLTRAHSAVFNVKKLKSVVVRKFRPEHENTFGPPGGNDPDAPSGSKVAALTASQAFPSSLSQKQMVKKAAAASTTSTNTPSSDSSFDGLDFANWGAGHPPDENGDVGPNYYIQTVNTSIGIYDKTNGNRVAAFTFNSFMSQGHFGNLCDTDNFGDPVVLYDTYENRWMITDFAFKVDGSGNVSPQTVYQCFAVSKTGDPVNGGWNYYSILDPGGLGDYPKFGVWPDGIYMSANIFGYASGASFTGYHMWALNKQQMYAGAPQVSVVDFSGDTTDFTVIPANSRLQDGTPPAGSPEYFVSTEQFLNAVSIYKFQVNWDKISTSTFTATTGELAPNCWPNATPANASTTANAADVLAIRAMFAAQYTNQGGQESVWVAHTVQRGVSANNTTCNATTGGNATVRWYQANVTGGTVGGNLTQGSSYDPDGANTNFRYQPALAVDHAGDMGMTYTESNATTNPKVMFNGRLASDPLNTLGTESTLIAGTGSQSGNCGTSACVRWGDYAGMELDPDGCEFWMTGEYFATSGLNDLTRIGSFHYPGCTPIGNGTLSGTVTDGTNPISGATVTLGSRTTTTDPSGNYSFTVPAGTYASLLADQPGYTEGSAATLAVPDGGSLTQNFTLSSSATSGCFQDNSQSTFQRGVPTNCDLTGSPGNVQLASPDNSAAQNQTITPAGFGISNTAWAGQTFTPTITGQLRRFSINLFCASCTTNSPNITVSIRATSGTTPVPTGADLATATIAGFNDGGAGGYQTATFASPLTVTAGTRYAVIFRNATTFSTGTMAYSCSCATTGYSNTNPYASGQRVTSSNSGSTWTADTTVGGRDLGFIAYINPGFATSGTFVSSVKDANPATGSTAHWQTLDFTAVTPASTGVQFQVAGSNSQYGPWNYVGPDGTASTFYTTTGGSLSQFNGDRYIRYQSTLTSSNSSVTPSLSSVTTCFSDSAVASTALNASDATGTYGGTTTLTATLTSGGNPVSNETVNFSLNGNSVGGATTDVNGVATLNNASLAGINAGSYPGGVSASFAGDSSYTLSSGSGSLTVSKADQTIMIGTHAPATAAVDDQFTVAATGGGSGNAIAYGSSGSCTNTGATYTITSTGACTVTYDQAGNSNYNAASQLTDSVNSSKANQTINVTTAAPASAVYGTGFTVAATGGNSGNAVTFGSSGGCTNTGASFTMTSGSTDCTVTFDQAGNSNYNDATQVTETVTAQKAAQTITVTMDAPPIGAYNSTFDVAANAPGGTVSFSNSGVCSNVGAHFTMTSGTGTCTVQFDQAGDANYSAASQVTESVTATKINQSISFSNPGTHQFGTADFDPGATASSGYAVTYGASGDCSIVGGIVHLTGAGSCTVTADQAGDANYNAATQVQQTFPVTRADQAIVIGTNAPSTAVYGTGFTVAATGGGSGNAVTYGSSGSCTNSGADFTMTSGLGTCTVTYDQAGDSNYNAAPQSAEIVTATRADQVIQITQHAPSTASVDDQFTVAATGGDSGNAIDYGSSGGCTNTGATYTVTSAGTCTVTYDQNGDTNYAPAPQLTDIVNSSKADQTIHIVTGAPATAAYWSQFTVSATGGGSGNPVTYGSSGSCTNAGADFSMTSGAGTCTVTYDQAGNAGFNDATQVTETVTAVKANQTITFANPGTHTYGNVNFAPGATASSGNTVSYSASGACSIVSGMVHLTGAGSCTVTASQAGDTNYNAAPQVQRMFSVGKAALSITAGPRQKFFAETLTLGTTAFTSSGLVGTDSVSGVTLTSSGAAAAAASGSYPIVPSAAVAGPSTNLGGNYAITYHSGTLTVTAVGLIGLNSVSVATTAGSKIDSFNSLAGVYGTSNHGATAFVLSNGALTLSGVSLLGNAGSAQGSVSVAHTASVSGNVIAGTTVSNSGTIGGTVTQHSPGPPFSATVATCAPLSGKAGISGGTFTYASGNLTVKKGTVKLASKTYCFHNVTINAGAKLSVTGPVTIHLTGKLNAKGQIVSTTNLPAKLHIDTSFTGANGVAIVGGANAAMSITAPKTSVTITGGSYFGTVLAQTVALKGKLAFHADQH